jgi:REP element-mobilizing transposase RayT
MSNHLHIILRNRPDILATWSDEKVARHWWKLGRSQHRGKCQTEEPTAEQLRPLLEPRRNQHLRQRLGSISWLMRYLAEPIARRANKEEGCTGRFWEGRFKCQKLVDETAVLACSTYVDLNPIRAGMTQTPEESLYTSIRARIISYQQHQFVSAQFASDASGVKPPASILRASSTKSEPRKNPRAGDAAPLFTDQWLAPIALDERTDKYMAAIPATSGLRVSDKGFLAMDTKTYFELVDWTGRQLRKASPAGRIPSNAKPILKRLGLGEETWCELVGRFGQIFRQAAGGPVALAREAERRGQRWLQTRQSPLLATAT